MNKYIDISGQRYGRVTVLRFAGTTESGNAVFECVCDCGVKFLAMSNNLRRGFTSSCGCYRSERTIETNHARRARRLLAEQPTTAPPR